MKSNRRWGSFCALTTAALAFMAAEASSGALPDGFQPSAQAHLTVDGKSFPVPLVWNGEAHATRDHEIVDPQGRWSARVSVSMNPDPEIVYQLSTIDFGAASTFSLFFQQAIVATAAPGTVRHLSVAHATNSGTDGAEVSPAQAPAGIAIDADATAERAVYSLSTSAGASWINVGLDQGPAFSSASPADTQGPFDESGAGPAASGQYDAMRVDVNFTMSGGEDSFSASGRVSVE